MPLDADKIRRRREQLKLTQAEAADRGGLELQSYCRIEQGKRPDPRLSTAERIARALETQIPKLLASD